MQNLRTYNIKKLWAFGDSYTFGHDLSDCPSIKDPTPSQLSYAALVAKELGYEYECKANGYYANNAIARTVIENINNIDQNDIVLIMWTFPVRREFMLEDGLRTISQKDDHEFAKHYIKYADLSDHWMIKQSLKDIYLTQELLCDHRYLFLSSVSDLNKAVINRYKHIELTDKIDIAHWVVLDKQLGFHEWSEFILNRKHIGHPPDQAHQELANLILKNYATKI